MLRIVQSKNTLFDGETVAEELYTTPNDCEDFFDNLVKPSKVNAVPRSIFVRAGVLTTVRGSAYMEYGNTKVVAIVAPPQELMRATTRRGGMGVIKCFVNFTAFASGNLETLPDREQHLGRMLTKALEPLVCRNEFLNFQLSIRVLVIEDDGCLLSTSINCCGVALTECGISTYDVITASTACIYRDHVFVNPSAKVEELMWKHRNGRMLANTAQATCVDDLGMLVTASMDTFGQVAQCQQAGYMTSETYTRLLEYTLTINKRIRQIIGDVLLERVKELYKADLREQDENKIEDDRLTVLIENLKQQGLSEFLQSNIKEDQYTKR